jgi:excinuclease UvrABC ATPase subunit
MVELLFLPSVYSPCPACHGARYNPETLTIRHRGKNTADVLGLAASTDWIIDMGPGAGEQGGRIVAAGPPAEVASKTRGATSTFLRTALAEIEQG